MIRTIIWTGWASLKRDKVALLLTFALPIAFFSVFVGIFGGSVGGGGGTNRVRVVVVDEDKSETSDRFIKALARDEALDVRLTPRDLPDQPYTRAVAESLVKSGDVPVAVVVPKGFGEHFPSFGPKDDDIEPVQLLADKQRDPVAHQMVAGLMQKAAMMGAPDLMIERGLSQFDKFAGGMTPQQRTAMDKWLPMLRDEVEKDQAAAQNGASTQPAAANFGGMVVVEVVNVHREHKTDWEAFVSFQVAQTAVMFLLFSMAGAAGTLLDEQENGTLERLLNSKIGMNGLLIGKWLFVALMGMVQLLVMFLWAWKPFGLNIWTAHHMAGLVIMTVVTAAAGAGFGMVLATACRSRAQLGGVSTIVILIMSAVGGSMFPRFLMSEQLQTIGLATFNGWALDGYRKVFYDNAPLIQLWPQVTVLAGAAVVFMAIARLLARRWEAA